MGRFLIRFVALVHSRNKEFVRDRSALAWNILFPVFVIFGFGFAFNHGEQDFFKVAFHGDLALARASGAQYLSTKYIQFIEMPDLDGSLAKLKRHQIDMVVDPVAGGARYWINESSPKGYLAEKVITSSAVLKMQKQTVNGEEIRYVDWLISGLLAMNLMFSSLFGVGYNIVRYRKNGVLKRLRATPLRAFEFLLAQVASRLILLIATTVVVYAGCNFFIHFRMQGSYLDLMIVLTLGSICLISLGLLMSSRTSSEEFAGGILNLITWPMMFLSGVWFSLEGANPWMQKFALIFPLSHVIGASRAIMTEGASLTQVAPSLMVLGGMTLVFLISGSWLFRWR